MAVDHVKSTGITNADANTANNAGELAVGTLRAVRGYTTAVASSSVDATYQIWRIPSNCSVQRIIFESEAQTAGKVDIGAYYATDGFGGKPTALLAAAAIDQDFFATAVDCASAVTPTDVTNESGTYTLDKRTQPIWQALGLTSDPGGNFDICLTVVTTAVTTGTGKWGGTLYYLD